jgi:hypothetical protein
VIGLRPALGRLLARWGARVRAGRGPGGVLSTLRDHVLARCEGRRLLGRLSNGEAVWSRLGDDHLVAHPDVRVLLATALSRVTAPDTLGETGPALVDFGRPIGLQTCVPTSSGDDVVYARRIGRTTGCTRFVRGGRPSPCSTLRVVCRRTESGLAELKTAYVGQPTPPEPGSDTARASDVAFAESVEFWSRHALVWDGRVDPTFGVHRTPPRDGAGVRGGGCETAGATRR